MATAIDKVFDQGFCLRFRVCPELDGGAGRVWISDKTDLSILGYVGSVLGTSPVSVRTSDTDLGARIAARFNLNADTHTSNQSGDNAEPALEQRAIDSQVVREINNIISDCVRSRASDIHFEPRERLLACRKRVDGLLIEHTQISKAAQPETISRIKIMAGLDIAEKRRPQDGRIRFPIDGRTVDIRVSVIPTDFGEKAVLRLLDKQSLRLDLGELGFTQEQLAIFREGISVSNGIILVTGPTGSGKTTTLYAALQSLKSPEMNISTVEDPIEYNLEGINQTQVQPEIGRTFASMLRAILRQDPDIIMIGEIRDRETLDIAIQASLTGHLVLSTVHTNSAVATITRLLDMGAEPYLLASCLKLIVAQRLVRRLCTHCQTGDLDEAYAAAARKLGMVLGAKAQASSGCERCSRTGYQGRTAIYELLGVDNQLSQAINNGASELEMLGLARQGSFHTMAETSSNLVNTGVTTPMEVLRELSA